MTRITVWRTSRLAWKSSRCACWRLFPRVGVVWHAQNGAQHVNAGLPVFLPGVSQASQSVDPGQPDCGLV